MEFALNQIYLSATRSFWRNRLMGLAMLGVFLVAVGVSVGASTAIAAAPEHTIVGFIIGAFVMAVGLLFISRGVSNRKSRFSGHWPGAATGSGLIRPLHVAFPS